MWVVGLVSSAVYVVVFYMTGSIALSALYIYFVAVSVYGMYCWRFAQKPHNGAATTVELLVSRLKMRLGIVLTLITIVLFLGIGYVLDNYVETFDYCIKSSDTPQYPYSEALVVSLNIVATWMLAHKILEQWFLWIFANFFMAALSFWSGLYPTACLFFVYGIMSIVGWSKWKQSLKNEE